MERLSFNALVADASPDPRSSAWLTDNIWHPFVNGTGVKQIYNNFVEEKLPPSYVPEADTLSRDWIIHNLASASGAVVTYAIAGKLAGVGMRALSSSLALEGGAARFLNSNTASQILGAGAFDFIKAPNAGETRLGNSLGSMAAFGVFHVGNSWLSQHKAIAASNIYTGIGRAAVGAAGGLTGLEASNLITRQLLPDAHQLTADDRWRAITHGAFINTALPPLQQKLSDVIDGRTEMKGVNATVDVKDRAALPTDRIEDLFEAAVKKGGDQQIKVILLKQQFELAAKHAQMERVAGELATFIMGAKKSLHTAIYDLRLKDPVVEKLVVDALNNRAEAGVDVKLAFFKPNAKPADAVKGIVSVEPHHGEVPASGPSPELLAKLSPKIGTKTVAHHEPVNSGSSAEIKIPDPFNDALKPGGPQHGAEGIIDLQTGKDGGLDSQVGTAGITGGGKLMHHKYIVRDAGTPDAAVWTGSTNFTDSAFGSQDNNIIQIRSRALARVYEKNFGQLWENGSLAGTGKDLHTKVSVGGSSVTVAFSPGDGTFIDAEFARRIEAANKQVHIASMVISSPQILEALANRIDAGKLVEGIYDGPQMRNVVNAWGRSTSPESAVKIALWERVKGSLTPKNSHPYNPDGPHDFMHNKTVTVDDSVVITGSHNLSNNATKNAENIVAVENPEVAQQYTTYIKDLIKTYKGQPRRVAK